MDLSNTRVDLFRAKEMRCRQRRIRDYQSGCSFGAPGSTSRAVVRGSADYPAIAATTASQFVTVETFCSA